MVSSSAAIVTWVVYFAAGCLGTAYLLLRLRSLGLDIDEMGRHRGFWIVRHPLLFAVLVVVGGVAVGFIGPLLYTWQSNLGRGSLKEIRKASKGCKYRAGVD